MARRQLLALSSSDLSNIEWEEYSAAQGKKFAFRLRKLADLLEGLSPAQFRFDQWIANYHPKQSCKTAACALGHAVLNRHQKFRGLKLKLCYSSEFGEISLQPMGRFFHHVQWYGGDEAAANDYFGPDSYDLAFLGNYYCYRGVYGNRVPYDMEAITAKMAIKRLRELANHWEKNTANNLSPSRRARLAA